MMLLLTANDFPMVFRRLHLEPWIVDLLMQPSGQFGCGGVIYIGSNAESGTFVVKRFF